MRDLPRFHRFAVAVLLFTLAVILWGGYVRVSGAGAGCGNHWPTCNGQIVPRSPGVNTVIEFTHRLTSGGLLVLIAGQVGWAFWLFPRRHEVRRATLLVFALLVTEALVGGGLVLFEMVAGNKSVARGYWIAAHLVNTFALLAAMALVVVRTRRARGLDTDVAGPVTPALVRALGVGLLAVVLVAMSGAIVALGDTLFPARSLAEGFAQDLSPSAHMFVRLRAIHPALAVVSAIYLLAVSAIVAGRDVGGGLRRAAGRVAGLVLLQLGVGLGNLVLLAPITLQIIHLFVADLVWLSLVVLTAHAARAAVAAGHRAPAHAALPTSA